jgi:antitoxin component YwqK of YwqJK toxin-antitoxin module
MGKNIFISVVILVFSISGLMAGPERYDHLEMFKNKEVKEDGPKEEIVQNEKGEQIAKAVYQYNTNKQINQIIFFKNNNADGKNLYIYDENGLKQEELFNSENKLVEKVLYNRNKAGEVIEFEVFDASNVSIVKWKYQYKNGKISSGTRLVDGEASERFSNEYTDKTITQGIFADNNENAGNVIAYLENSKVVKRIKTDYTGVFFIEYKYDTKGRIEKMIFFTQDEKAKPRIEKTHLFHYSLPYNFQPGSLSLN